MRQKKDFSCMQSADDDSFRRKNKRDEFRFNSIASCLSEVTKSAVNSSEYWLLLHGFKNNKDENNSTGFVNK